MSEDFERISHRLFLRNYYFKGVLSDIKALFTIATLVWRAILGSRQAVSYIFQGDILLHSHLSVKRTLWESITLPILILRKLRRYAIYLNYILYITSSSFISIN